MTTSFTRQANHEQMHVNWRIKVRNIYKW